MELVSLTMRNKTTTFATHSAQRGMTLLFALLTLVLLTLASLALVRAVDVSTLLIGNLGFKQDATSSADQATRQAIEWLNTNTAALNSDVTDSGYYASTKEFDSTGITRQPPLDVTGSQVSNDNRQLIRWNRQDCSYASNGSFASCALAASEEIQIQNNTARYIIFRQCNKAGDISVNNTIHCARPLTAGGGQSPVRGDLNYADFIRFSSSNSPYYRIIVRVEGARNTTSFTETIVHLSD